MNKLFFSQVREDPTKEIEVCGTKKKILLIASGGCTICSLVSKDCEITAVDASLFQLKLTKLKIAFLQLAKTKKELLSFLQDPQNPSSVTELLKRLKPYLDENDYKFWINKQRYFFNGINQSGAFEILFRDLVKSNFNFEKLFSRNYLVNIFGENAVLNSLNKEFFDHFKYVFKTYETKYKVNQNYFYDQVIQNKYSIKCLPYYFTNIQNIKAKVNYSHNNLISFLESTNEKYDVIQTSNLTDWMDNKERAYLIKLVYDHLDHEGIIISRRLNGDYSLKNLLSKKFKTSYFEDKSHFYSECVLGTKATESPS